MEQQTHQQINAALRRALVGSATSTAPIENAAANAALRRMAGIATVTESSETPQEAPQSTPIPKAYAGAGHGQNGLVQSPTTSQAMNEAMRQGLYTSIVNRYLYTGKEVK